MAIKKVPVLAQKPDELVEVPILAKSIADMAAATKKALSSGMSRKAIIVLVHHHSKVPMRDIEIVLNNLESLDRTWLTRST